ncbi:CBS domain-containing protein [Acidiferrimicrobium sp. IK]|uniref:CBS domain-containing protein n=1 Tax=Acidiferrimicrobium sp. IK TaxID=2871700 RepID=UPI0021CB0212|nr:CBS domain-containing protein [Acidiferrimicrobium sp. IK]MCU4183502.1 CBS domain-containing protein [Acidiferrimicrobium sp. IK]
MKVEALLRRKGSDVVTVRPDDRVGVAVRSLTEHNIGALVVSPDGRTVEGIVSERDIVNRLGRGPAGLLESTVASVMVTDVQTCSLADDVASLMSVMTNRRIRHLPVVEGGALAGMVSIGDVVKARVDELEEDRDRLHDFINAR